MKLGMFGIIGKKEDKELEPQYYMSRTNIKTLNYKVYYMNRIEKVLYFLAAFIVGGYCGYLFYGGLFQNEFAEPTVATHISNVLIASVIGSITGFVFLPIRVQQIIDKRQRNLKRQFRDMLESLSTSLGAGKNVNDSFEAVAQDMLLQYDEDAYINNELKVIISGIRNNQEIEVLLYDFGRRSGVKDIVMFASIFRISYRKGGNIKEIIMNTNTIMKDKFDIAEEIETAITSNKSELYAMMVMPVVMVAVFKGMDSDFGGNFSTPAGVAATTASLILYALAFKLGSTIMDIKV
ncbi:MAG: type II secretion system F family protein [Butyrivibrio sp.]|nr:type II secretion system F family protein [Butyrivibrio sp.]